MKDKPRVLTILAGVITILLGIFVAILSVFILLGAVAGSDPLLMLVTLGMLLMLQIILFVVALAVSIIVIIIGSLEIKLGTQSNYEYSLRKGSVIGYCCFDAIIAIIAGVACFVFRSSSVLIVCAILVGILLICFLFKLLDYVIFKKKVNKGLISIDRPKTNINLDALNPKKDHVKDLEKLNKLKEDNLITEEEYNDLRKKLLEDITK